MVDRFTITAAEQDPWIDADPSGQWVRYSDYAALEAKLAERAGGVNEDALRALAQAYDREDAAQRGEPDPWDLDDPGDIGDSDTWVSERLACARAAAEAFLSALSRTGAVKVKALGDWRRGYCDDEVTIEQVSTGFGSIYQVRIFEGTIWLDYPVREKEAFPTVEAAKAAAQADYERIILSALEPSTPEGQQPVAEALELSGNTGELIDKMAEAIRGDTTSNETPCATLSEDRKIGGAGMPNARWQSSRST